MNSIVRSIPRMRFSGGGVRVSYLGDQVFVEFPTQKFPNPQLHAYWVADATAGGGSPKITVTPGTHNASITPTISGTALTVIPPPTLTLGTSDTLVYFQIDYNSSNIATTIEIKSGTSLPTATIVVGTAGSDYKLLSTIAITAVGSTYTVNCFNDAVSGPQQYLQCGTTSTSTLT